jgi:hypothetical protein
MCDVILLFKPLKAPDLTFKYSPFDPHCVRVGLGLGLGGIVKQTFYKTAVFEIETRCVFCDVGNKCYVLLRRK